MTCMWVEFAFLAYCVTICASIEDVFVGPVVIHSINIPFKRDCVDGFGQIQLFIFLSISYQ